MLDDNRLKVQYLGQFISWLALKFAPYGHTFTKGFENPLDASQRADMIQKAVRDPQGLILLDVGFAKGDAADVYSLAAINILETNRDLITKDEVDQFFAVYLKKDYRARLAATVGVLAKKLNARTLWCSRLDNVDVQHNFTEVFDQIAWPGEMGVGAESEGEEPYWSELDERKIASVLRPFHEDEYINEGVCFALSPKPDAEPVPQWEHNSLEVRLDRFGVQRAGLQNQQVAAWLNMSIPDDSGKALFLSPQIPWTVKSSENSYPISGRAIQSAASKLGLTLRVEISQEFKFPIQPLFPMLLALADLCYELGKNGLLSTHGLLLTRGSKHELCIRVNLTDRKGSRFDLARLESAYADFCQGSSGRYRDLCVRLFNLAKGKINLSYRVEAPRSILFTGISTDPVTSMTFDQNANAIIVTWRPSP